MSGDKKKEVRVRRQVERKRATASDPNVARLREIVAIMEASTLSDLEYEDSDIEVRLTRGGRNPTVMAAPAAPAPAAPSPAAPVPAANAASAPAPTNDDDDPSVFVVRSPIVGTFYQSPAPTSPAYTAVGQKVGPGQVLCIIEAMKLMNEIECEVSGTVLQVMVTNGKPVQYDEPLFRISVDP